MPKLALAFTRGLYIILACYNFLEIKKMYTLKARFRCHLSIHTVNVVWNNFIYASQEKKSRDRDDKRERSRDRERSKDKGDREKEDRHRDREERHKEKEDRSKDRDERHRETRHKSGRSRVSLHVNDIKR